MFTSMVWYAYDKVCHFRMFTSRQYGIDMIKYATYEVHESFTSMVCYAYDKVCNFRMFPSLSNTKPNIYNIISSTK